MKGTNIVGGEGQCGAGALARCLSPKILSFRSAPQAGEEPAVACSASTHVETAAFGCPRSEVTPPVSLRLGPITLGGKTLSSRPKRSESERNGEPALSEAKGDLLSAGTAADASHQTPAPKGRQMTAQGVSPG
jgi:hypothetical protein